MLGQARPRSRPRRTREYMALLSPGAAVYLLCRRTRRTCAAAWGASGEVDRIWASRRPAGNGLAVGPTGMHCWLSTRDKSGAKSPHRGQVDDRFINEVASVRRRRAAPHRLDRNTGDASRLWARFPPRGSGCRCPRMGFGSSRPCKATLEGIHGNRGSNLIGLYSRSDGAGQNRTHRLES